MAPFYTQSVRRARARPEFLTPSERPGRSWHVCDDVLDQPLRHLTSCTQYEVLCRVLNDCCVLPPCLFSSRAKRITENYENKKRGQWPQGDQSGAITPYLLSRCHLKMVRRRLRSMIHDCLISAERFVRQTVVPSVSVASEVSLNHWSRYGLSVRDSVCACAELSGHLWFDLVWIQRCSCSRSLQSAHLTEERDRGCAHWTSDVFEQVMRLMFYCTKPRKRWLLEWGEDQGAGFTPCWTPPQNVALQPDSKVILVFMSYGTMVSYFIRLRSPMCRRAATHTLNGLLASYSEAGTAVIARWYDPSKQV